MKNLVLLLAISCLLSCSKLAERIDSFLECDQISENYQAYVGEEIGCQFHYRITKFDDQQFIELNSYCADLARPYVINEFCEDICETSPYDANSKCGKYLMGREVLEIIYIEKP